MTYRPPHEYTKEELLRLKIEDLRRDAEFAERQAEKGPHFPNKGITRESLIKYARECRREIEELEERPDE